MHTPLTGACLSPDSQPALVFAASSYNWRVRFGVPFIGEGIGLSLPNAIASLSFGQLKCDRVGEYLVLGAMIVQFSG
ncbi:MAG TPA: hypothetical protein V6D50_24845 [Chroococcales cyanobacterium]